MISWETNYKKNSVCLQCLHTCKQHQTVKLVKCKSFEQNQKLVKEESNDLKVTTLT